MKPAAGAARVNRTSTVMLETKSPMPSTSPRRSNQRPRMWSSRSSAAWEASSVSTKPVEAPTAAAAGARAVRDEVLIITTDDGEFQMLGSLTTNAAQLSAG